MTKLQKAYFGGGCFWCIEAVFKMFEGIEQVTSGYVGGSRKPTYDEVSRGHTGHVETVEVVFDPSKIIYEELLEIFFAAHDPTTADRQGNDVGTQYRSVIFYVDEEQKEEAEKHIDIFAEKGEYEHPIVTVVEPLEKFWEAEEYHQDYFDRNTNASYCQVIIAPKIAKVRRKFKEKLKKESRI